VLKLALTALVVVVLTLAAVTLLPERARVIPDSAIHLHSARVVLYPQADPQAIWYFGAETVLYEPSTRETVLLNLFDGQRTVGGEIDFTLQSERIVIDRDDNLRGERMFVHLVEAEMDLDMQAKGERLVLIDQRRGRFEVPRLELLGENMRATYEDMRTSFDLTEFEAGGPGTVGYSEFEDAPGARQRP
jgi:hypothetical protein